MKKSNEEPKTGSGTANVDSRLVQYKVKQLASILQQRFTRLSPFLQKTLATMLLLPFAFYSGFLLFSRADSQNENVIRVQPVHPPAHIIDTRNDHPRSVLSITEKKLLDSVFHAQKK